LTVAATSTRPPRRVHRRCRGWVAEEDRAADDGRGAGAGAATAPGGRL